MRAFIQDGKSKMPSDNGGKDDLSVFKVIDIPAPGPPPSGHVTIRVHAAALNPVDYKRTPFFQDENPSIVGYDAAGVVEAVAPDVTTFSVGDRVFGDVIAETLGVKPAYVGSCAELIYAPANVLASIPESVTFVQAAALPLVSITGLQVIREYKTRKGDKLFIGAGAGGVGIHTIQIAKAVFEVGEIATTASPNKEELVRKYGADIVVNYRDKDVGKELAGWGDVVIDTMGHFDTIRKIAKPGTGRVTSIVDSSGEDIIKYLMHPNSDDMQLIADLVKNGKLSPVIDSEFSLEDGMKAMERQLSGRATGKIIIKVIEWEYCVVGE